MNLIRPLLKPSLIPHHSQDKVPTPPPGIKKMSYNLPLWALPPHLPRPHCTKHTFIQISECIVCSLTSEPWHMLPFLPSGCFCFPTWATTPHWHPKLGEVPLLHPPKLPISLTCVCSPREGTMLLTCAEHPADAPWLFDELKTGWGSPSNQA